MRIILKDLPINSTIPAIKAAKFAFGLGLRDAKTLVDTGRARVSDTDNNYLNVSTFNLEGEQSDTHNIDQIREYINGSESNIIVGIQCDLPNVSVEYVKDKIDSNGNQALNVPNTAEGRLFLHKLATYLNTKSYTRRSRGRGSRTNGKGTQAYVPIANSEWIAVYINSKDDTQRETIERLRLELDNAKAEAAYLKTQLALADQFGT